MHNLYTFGYTGLQPAEIFAAAARVDAMIADIRYSPHSRHEQWNGRTLGREWGSRYLHIGELGNRNYKGEMGEGIMLASPQLGSAIVLEQLRFRPVMLMCACPNWETCHRRAAAEFIQQRDTGLTVVHLTADTLRSLGGLQQLSLF